jgi:hypothetical protein
VWRQGSEQSIAVVWWMRKRSTGCDTVDMQQRSSLVCRLRYNPVARETERLSVYRQTNWQRI